MGISLKHKFVTTKDDHSDPDLVSKTAWNDEHELTLDTGKVIGRTTAGNGAAEELTLSQVLDFIGSAARGDLLFRGASAWARLAAGAAGQVLTTGGSGADPEWADAAGGGGDVALQVFTSSGTYTPTAGMKFALVIATGAGAGGRTSTANSNTGSGGPAGGTAINLFTAEAIGASQSVTIGSGGSASSAGGTTTFGSLLTANGGPAPSSDGSESIGVAGGTASGGAFNINGGSGGSGLADGTSNRFGGHGGSSIWGGGGSGGASRAAANSAGSDGTVYGSGGGGGARIAGGGSGAGGVVFILEFL